MSDLRLSRFWDRQLEGGLPDCRVRRSDRERAIVNRGRMAFEKVYCANCHKEAGLVTAEWTAHVFFICDDCARTGGPPGCIEVTGIR